MGIRHHERAPAEVSPPRWIIEGLFYEGSLYLLAGPPKLGGKSLFAIEACRCVSMRVPLMDTLRVRQRRAIYLPFEDGERRFIFRMRKSGVRHGVRDPLGRKVPFYFSDEMEDAEGVLRRMERCGEPDEEGNLPKPCKFFLVVDSLSELCGANEISDENSNAEATRLLSRWRKAAQVSLSTVIMIHHVNKEGDIRGASAWRGASDGWVTVEPGDEPGVRWLKPELRDAPLAGGLGQAEAFKIVDNDPEDIHEPTLILPAAGDFEDEEGSDLLAGAEVEDRKKTNRATVDDELDLESFGEGSGEGEGDGEEGDDRELEDAGTSEEESSGKRGSGAGDGRRGNGGSLLGGAGTLRPRDRIENGRKSVEGESGERKKGDGGGSRSGEGEEDRGKRGSNGALGHAEDDGGWGAQEVTRITTRRRAGSGKASKSKQKPQKRRLSNDELRNEITAFLIESGADGASIQMLQEELGVRRDRIQAQLENGAMRGNYDTIRRGRWVVLSRDESNGPEDDELDLDAL